MKVLMFGWEYPPHVYGGLATANFGISEGLHAHNSLSGMESAVPLRHSQGQERRIQRRGNFRRTGGLGAVADCTGQDGHSVDDGVRDRRQINSTS